ncbi:MAG: ABC transporter substrate-binding protein [Massiliimalia sp.]
MKLSKRAVAFMLAGAMMAGMITSCGGGGETTSGGTNSGGGGDKASGNVEIWSFLTQEEMNYYADAYNDLTGNSVTMRVFPGDQYLTKLQTAFRSGTNAPDIAYLEIAHLGQFKETGMLEDLSSYGGTEILDNQIPYVADLSMNSKGEISGISWQATPGGFWYKKALAKEYLGTDDPDEVAEIMSSWESITEAGKSVYEKSGGKVALLQDTSSARTILNNTKGVPWVDEEGNLPSDDILRKTFETEKMLRDNNVDAKIKGGTPAEASGMYETDPFICFAQATWGLHYVIKANTPDEKEAECENKWGFVPGPGAYQSGGTWMGMYSKSKNKEAAWDYIKTMTSDEEFFSKYLVNDLGDFPGYIPAIETAIAENHTDPFTGDQNIFQYFYDTAMEVKNDGMTKYDSKANDLFGAKVDLLLAGDITVDEAIEQFKADMKSAFPEIK